jgi:hypothetical protein
MIAVRDHQPSALRPTGWPHLYGGCPASKRCGSRPSSRGSRGSHEQRLMIDRHPEAAYLRQRTDAVGDCDESASLPHATPGSAPIGAAVVPALRGCTMIEIALLGRVAVTVDGAPLTGEAAQRRRLALLALLCEAPLRPLSRDRLMLHLWPESDTESARRLLSASLYVLRKALGADAIRVCADQLELNAALVRVDAILFEDAARAGSPATCAELLRRACDGQIGWPTGTGLRHTFAPPAQKRHTTRKRPSPLQAGTAVKSSWHNSGGGGTRTPKGLRPADFESAALPIRLRLPAAADGRCQAIKFSSPHAPFQARAGYPEPTRRSAAAPLSTRLTRKGAAALAAGRYPPNATRRRRPSPACRNLHEYRYGWPPTTFPLPCTSK